MREGSLEAPVRHPLDWENPDFTDPDKLDAELRRVFDICHGCRRCVSLCQSFPTLFDLVDESPTLEVDGVRKEDYWKVVDHCYLCDLCYMTKCPYVPPHEWNLDFPHLMLRAKAVHFKKGTTKLRDKVLTSTDTVGRLAGIPVVAQTVNAVNRIGTARKALQAVAGIHSESWLPEFSSRPLRSRLEQLPLDTPGEPAGETKGKVALFATCYMNRNEPGPGEDLVAVFNHNGIPVTLAEKERCCGMPKLELGDLESVKAAKEAGRPGQILNEAECSKVWSDASGGQDLSAEKAKPFVTNFEQVDKNGDNMISSAEFTDGCKMGFVQQAAAGSESSTGAGAGTEGAE